MCVCLETVNIPVGTGIVDDFLFRFIFRSWLLVLVNPKRACITAVDLYTKREGKDPYESSNP